MCRVREKDDQIMPVVKNDNKIATSVRTILCDQRGAVITHVPIFVILMTRKCYRLDYQIID